jgi:hypothetical protein
MGLVAQKLAHWLGGACSVFPLLRVTVLVIALVLVGPTWARVAIQLWLYYVVVDNSKFFRVSTFPQLLLKASGSLRHLERL